MIGSIQLTGVQKDKDRTMFATLSPIFYLLQDRICFALGV